jgi:hypothetical protein
MKGLMNYFFEFANIRKTTCVKNSLPYVSYVGNQAYNEEEEE